MKVLSQREVVLVEAPTGTILLQELLRLEQMVVELLAIVMVLQPAVAWVVRQLNIL
jgi:hypothetical protein